MFSSPSPHQDITFDPHPVCGPGNAFLAVGALFGEELAVVGGVGFGWGEGGRPGGAGVVRASGRENQLRGGGWPGAVCGVLSGGLWGSGGSAAVDETGL